MSYSSDLPQLSIIFIFVNEALSVLLRSVHTAIQRTPPHLLKEIILVDDHSNSGEDRSHLTFFRAKLFKGLGDHTGHSAQNFTDGNILQFNFYSCFDTRIDTRIKLQFSIHFLWFVWVHFLFTPLCYQCGSLETYKISYLHKSPVSHPKCLV